MQQIVRINQTTAFVGELIEDSPTRAFGKITNSGDATQNVVGRVFSVVAGSDTDVSAGGLNVSGILIDPKTLISTGLASVGGDALDPTLTVDNGKAVTICNMGIIAVRLAQAGIINGPVYYASVDTVASSAFFEGASASYDEDILDIYTALIFDIVVDGVTTSTSAINFSAATDTQAGREAAFNAAITGFTLDFTGISAGTPAVGTWKLIRTATGEIVDFSVSARVGATDTPEALVELGWDPASNPTVFPGADAATDVGALSGVLQAPYTTLLSGAKIVRHNITGIDTQSIAFIEFTLPATVPI